MDSSSRTARPTRHGPRPLSAHIALAEWAWRAKQPRRLADFYRGIKAFRHHPYQREVRHRPTMWTRGSCRLIDYGHGEGWPLLVVPSLINRAYILDLMPGSSLLDYFSSHGVRPMLLDWGTGCVLDGRQGLDAVVLGQIKPALEWLHHHAGKPPLVLGYCMGGTLAMAMAHQCQERVAGLALLATPWSFAAENGRIPSKSTFFGTLASVAGHIGSAPIDMLQTLFAQIDPLDVPRKFARFAGLAPMSSAATRFVAIEDWLNDGVSLNADVAADCLKNWYGDNAPVRGRWYVGNNPVLPEQLDLPVCLAIPERDRIVPAASTLALVRDLPSCELIRLKSGHIGMIVGRHAKATLWQPLLRWLLSIAAMQKKSW